jgi:hypothetical protein
VIDTRIVRTAAVAAVFAVTTPFASDAVAEGERMPMLGGAVTASHDPDADLGGVHLEAAWWLWRVGVAAEGSRQWGLVADGSRSWVFGASARLLVFDTMLPSLVEGDRDVELGVELHGVVERMYNNYDERGESPVRYGAGLAIRLRGGGEDNFSNLLAESRVFVRVFAARGEPRAAGMVGMPDDGGGVILTREGATVAGERDVTILVGLGASWGTGTRKYLERFRQRPIETLWFGGASIDR